MSSLDSEALLHIISEETATVRLEAAVRELCHRLKLDDISNAGEIDIERTRMRIREHLARLTRRTPGARSASLGPADAPSRAPRSGVKRPAATLSPDLLARKGDARPLRLDPDARSGL